MQGGVWDAGGFDGELVGVVEEGEGDVGFVVIAVLAGVFVEGRAVDFYFGGCGLREGKHWDLRGNECKGNEYLVEKPARWHVSNPMLRRFDGSSDQGQRKT